MSLALWLLRMKFKQALAAPDDCFLMRIAIKPDIIALAKGLAGGIPDWGSNHEQGGW